MNRAAGVVENPIAEVVVTHVCGVWRRLALGIPSMWNIFRYNGNVAPRVPTDRLKAYLDRSQTHPFEFWISFSRSGEGWTEQLDLLDAIIPHLHRFRVLNILSDNDNIIDDFANRVGNASMPQLEYLAFCPDKLHDAPDEHIMTKWNPNVFLGGGAPSLKYLRLDETSIRDFRPPLSSLVHLRLERRYHVEEMNLHNSLFDDVLALPQLETLSIWGDFFVISGEAYASHPVIEAKRLKHVRLEGRKEILMHYFLSHVSAPALETLTLALLRLDVPLMPWPTPATDRFPSLHSLAFLRGAAGFGPDTLTLLMPWMVATRHIKRFILTSPLVQFMAASMAPPPGSDLPSRLTQIWTEVEEVTIDVDPNALQLSYKPLIVAFPNIKTLRVNKDCLQNVAEDEEWAELQMRLKFEITEIPEDDPRIPFHWPVGPEWLDTEDDPYMSIASLVMSERRGPFQT